MSESESTEAPPVVIPETDDQCEEDVYVTANMYITQHKGKALAKAIKAGVRDSRVFSALMKNQAVSRHMPAVLASYLSDANVVALLIDAGANVHFQEEALLVFAANAGYELTVDTLLAAGADPTTKSLAVAVAKNHVEIVEQLLSAGAKMTDLIWKKVITNTVASEDVDMLQSLAPQATTAQVQAAVKEFIEKDRLAAITALLTTAPKPTAASAVQLLCLKNPIPTAYIRLIRGLLQKGIRPDSEQVILIKEKGDPAIVKLLNRYA